MTYEDYTPLEKALMKLNQIDRDHREGKPVIREMAASILARNKRRADALIAEAMEEEKP